MAIADDSYIQKIDLIKMFHGDTLTIPVEFWYSPAEPIDLTEDGIEVLWSLCPYGQYDYPAIVKPMVVSDALHYLATVYLTYADMSSLDDAIKYNQQPIIRYVKDGLTREYRRAEGDVLFWPRINIDNYID
jgi:hypothetical protein